ncbi:hypothetical protein CRG98_047891 [Punica granatum]|uniref:Uncharacterized protein n=1 Tax=Punica granatum TaxID=22663 RepID=A0A2I0HJ47_PUNGR|nr:hypothetical protein CRG98_047891 [Punica granatum]
MKSLEYVTDMLLIALDCCDMVLRMHWLSTLEDILQNFKELQMKFNVKGREGVQKGNDSEEYKSIGDEQMDKLLHKRDRLAKVQLYSFQIPSSKKVRYVNKTTFRAHEWHYEYVVVSLELTKALFTFQRLMNEDYLNHIWDVFLTLRKHSSFATKSKCSFRGQKVEYLGHFTLAVGASSYVKKLKIVQEWLIPQTMKQLRGFPGFTGYYKRKDKEDIIQVIKHRFQRAQTRMKVQAHKRRFEREFAMGGMVYFELQPYRQV